MPRDRDRNERNNDGLSLYVSGFKDNTRPSDIASVFEPHGRIADVYIPKDYYSGLSRGFAYVQYRDEEDARRVFESGEVFSLDGRRLGVQYAQGRRKSPGQMRGHGHGGGGGGGRDRDDRDRRSRSVDRHYRPSSRRSRSRSRSPDRRGRRRDSRSPAYRRSRSRSPVRATRRSPSPRRRSATPGSPRRSPSPGMSPVRARSPSPPRHRSNSRGSRQMD